MRRSRIRNACAENLCGFAAPKTASAVNRSSSRIISAPKPILPFTRNAQAVQTLRQTYLAAKALDAYASCSVPKLALPFTRNAQAVQMPRRNQLADKALAACTSFAAPKLTSPFTRNAQAIHIPRRNLARRKSLPRAACRKLTRIYAKNAHSARRNMRSMQNIGLAYALAWAASSVFMTCSLP